MKVDPAVSLIACSAFNCAVVFLSAKSVFDSPFLFLAPPLVSGLKRKSLSIKAIPFDAKELKVSYNVSCPVGFFLFLSDEVIISSRLALIDTGCSKSIFLSMSL